MNVDIKTAIGWCAGVAVACIPATYVFTDNLIKTEIEQYKQSASWKLPELLSDLGVVSKELSAKLADTNELDRLKAFEIKHKAEFEQMQMALSEMKNRLASLEGDSVFLEHSKTIPLGEKGLLLGMWGTVLAYDTIKLQVGAESFRLDIGESHTYTSTSTKYTFSYKGHSNAKGYEIIVVRSQNGKAVEEQ